MTILRAQAVAHDNHPDSILTLRRHPPMEPTITPEHSDSPDATALIGELDAHLEPLYPRESRHGFSVQKLIADSVAFFVVRDDGAAVGCGGIKLFGTEYGEIKRMYVRPAFRGRGLAKRLLDHLADYARIHGVETLRLETGIHQHAAINLYEQVGFRRIPPFGPYRDDPVSRCYEKQLR
ncbi:MAG TPA: GNAT family N-acetyltransferase [Methylomirabilota bacterium]